MQDISIGLRLIDKSFFLFAFKLVLDIKVLTSSTLQEDPTD